MRFTRPSRAVVCSIVMLVSVGLIPGTAAADPEDEEGSMGAEALGVSAYYYPAQPAEDGEYPKGSAVVVRDSSGGGGGGHGHHGDDEPCVPTAEEQAAADKLVHDTREALSKYDNNPALLVADGFRIPFTGTPPPGRFYHVFNDEYVYDRSTADALEYGTVGGADPSQPEILNPERIESLMLAMTDQGLVAIGGMYMMPAEHKERQGDFLLPKAPFEGPLIGGCITKWHDHPDLGRMVNRSGAPTPQMLHVWTYPGLEPYREYSARELAYLWTPGSHLPTIQTPGPAPIVAELLP